jgi:hypothetical protein
VTVRRRDFVPLALLATLLAACASTVDVRRMATDAQPAYELRGSALTALASEAGWLCPKGYVTVQAWERQQATPPDANFVHRWWLAAERTFGAVDAGEARMTVQCKA